MIFADGTLVEIGSFIKNVGFPIALVVYIIWKFGPSHKKFIETATETNAQMPAIQARQAKAQEDTFLMLDELRKQNDNCRNGTNAGIGHLATAIDGVSVNDPNAVAIATNEARRAVRGG